MGPKKSKVEKAVPTIIATDEATYNMLKGGLHAKKLNVVLNTDLAHGYVLGPNAYRVYPGLDLYINVLLKSIIKEAQCTTRR